MIINVPFIYKAEIIKPRCSKAVTALVRDNVDVEIKEVNPSVMPVAFKVGDTSILLNDDRLWYVSSDRHETHKNVTLDDIINNTSHFKSLYSDFFVVILWVPAIINLIKQNS